MGSAVRPVIRDQDTRFTFQQAKQFLDPLLPEFYRRLEAAAAERSGDKSTAQSTNSKGPRLFQG